MLEQLQVSCLCHLLPSKPLKRTQPSSGLRRELPRPLTAAGRVFPFLIYLLREMIFLGLCRGNQSIGHCGKEKSACSRSLLSLSSAAPEPHHQGIHLTEQPSCGSSSPLRKALSPPLWVFYSYCNILQPPELVTMKSLMPESQNH